MCKVKKIKVYNDVLRLLALYKSATHTRYTHMYWYMQILVYANLWKEKQGTGVGGVVVASRKRKWRYG